MCCAFNSKSALSQSAYSDLVKEMQGSQQNIEDENVRKIRTGLANGLTVWLDQHGDETSMGTVYDNYNGFKVLFYFISSTLGTMNQLNMIKVFIGQPPEFPVVRERGFMLEPGLEHFVEVSSYTATTDSGAEALDVKYR